MKPVRAAAGFSMVEAIISLMIVSVMLVAVLQTVATARTAQRINDERAKGLTLADALMNEILEQPYDDPGGAAAIGVDSGETTGGSRTAFDDVDDYNGWTETAVVDADGAAVANTAGFTRSVTVQYVQPSALDTTSPTDTGVKRVRVTVQYQNRKVAELTAYRTRAWDSQWKP